MLETLRRWLRGSQAEEEGLPTQRRRSIIKETSEQSLPGTALDTSSASDDEVYRQARLAGHDVLQRVLAALQDSGGVHIESLATALGGLAGAASQWAMVDAIGKGDPHYANLSLMMAQGANGATYVVGDAINRPLIESEDSVWRLIAGELHRRGVAEPDVKDMFQHNASVMGTADYGRPRYPDGVNAGATPLEYASVLWPSLLTMHQKSGIEVRLYPCIYGFALQALLAMAGDQGQFDLTALAGIATESAISVAKLKP